MKENSYLFFFCRKASEKKSSQPQRTKKHNRALKTDLKTLTLGITQKAKETNPQWRVSANFETLNSDMAH